MAVRASGADRASAAGRVCCAGEPGMSPAVLRAMCRQRLVNSRQGEWRELYLPPMAELARSARWYRRAMYGLETPGWLRASVRFL